MVRKPKRIQRTVNVIQSQYYNRVGILYVIVLFSVFSRFFARHTFPLNGLLGKTVKPSRFVFSTAHVYVRTGATRQKKKTLNTKYFYLSSLLCDDCACGSNDRYGTPTTWLGRGKTADRGRRWRKKRDQNVDAI